MGKNGQMVRLFKNPVWEAFSRVHPLVPLLFWLPIIVTFYWRSTALFMERTEVTVLASMGGLAFWTWMEYAIHRWVFHAKPKGRIHQRLLYILHGNHHDDSNDLYRLLFPIVPSSLMGVFTYSIFSLILREFVNPFFASFLVGYLLYDYTHFLIHWHNPKSKLGKWIKAQHMEHHFVSPHLKYGVTSPVWDHFLGTN